MSYLKKAIGYMNIPISLLSHGKLAAICAAKWQQ